MRTFNALPALALLACSSAQADPYAFPASAAEPHAQLLDGSTTVCATWISGGACDVAAGTYTLVTYDTDWNQARVEQASVGGTSGAERFSRVEKSCGMPLGFATDIPSECVAVCPTGSFATGGACRVTSIADSPTAVGAGGYAGDTRYACVTSTFLLPSRIDTNPILTATVYCQRP